MINIHQNLLSEDDLLFLDSISSNFVETQIPHNNNNYVRKSLNIKEELLEYQKRCSKYLPDEYKLSGLWINKVTIETNIDDAYHNDICDLTIVTYINDTFEGGEFEFFEKILSSNLALKFDNIQVQFHDFVPDSDSRMKQIQNELSKTHFLTYQFEYVWENWKRK